MTSSANLFDHGIRGVGIRNHQLVLPSVICSSHIASRIAKEVDAISFLHQHGCGIIGEDVEVINRLFTSMALHPNISSVLVVGLGCETIQSRELVDRFQLEDESARFLVIQESGGVNSTVEIGVQAAIQLKTSTPIKSANSSNLTIGLDLARDYDSQNLRTHLERAGFRVVAAESGINSSDNLIELMHNRVHLAISFTGPSQPPTGFPLFPVINISSENPLHTAIQDEFDLNQSDLSDSSDFAQLQNLIDEVVAGKETISESKKIGEIRAPRMVRSV